MIRDACAIAEEWTLDPALAVKVVHMATIFRQNTGRELTIISGFRDPEKQRQLEKEGRPAAPVELSNHTVCPARAVDVRIQGFPTNAIKVALGDAAVMSALRWGGGSPVNSEGIPSDWNHVDLGPRMDAVAMAYRGQ